MGWSGGKERVCVHYFFVYFFPCDGSLGDISLDLEVECKKSALHTTWHCSAVLRELQAISLTTTTIILVIIARQKPKAKLSRGRRRRSAQASPLRMRVHLELAPPRFPRLINLSTIPSTAVITYMELLCGWTCLETGSGYAQAGGGSIYFLDHHFACCPASSSLFIAHSNVQKVIFFWEFPKSVSQHSFSLTFITLSDMAGVIPPFFGGE